MTSHHHDAARALIAYRLDPNDTTEAALLDAVSRVLNWSSCQVGQVDERLGKLMMASDQIRQAMLAPVLG